MILKALYDYYGRCDGLMRKGLELKEIGYLIVLEKDGTFLRIESRMIDNKTASSFCVLQTVKRSGKKYFPNYFWDKYEYVIGGNGEGEKKHKTFKELVNRFNTLLPHNNYINAIYNFYQKYKNVEAIIGSDILYEELKKTTKYISFLLNGSISIAAEDREIINEVLSKENTESIDNICLITGINSHISRLHTGIKLSKDTGPLVSFKTDRGYDSYGKKQAYNAPVSEEAEFAYTTALNYMLRSDSRNKFLIGNRTFVFWASKNDGVGKQAEECIWDMFGFNGSNDDAPNHVIEQVRKVFRAIYSGSLQTTMDDKFYILGLAPNTARIAVTYWAEIPLKVFAERINNHFDNMEIVDNERKIPKPYMGLRSILSSIALDGKINGKDSKLTPNLPEAVVKSIFQGLPYPYSLFVACIHRIRAEQQVPKEYKEKMKWDDTMVCRIAIIKAYLNRLNNNEQKIEIMLDKENKNQGYLCGRLFAVLDRKQEKARNQRSIRERYMNSASSTPSIVFPTILNLSRHHEKELKDDKERIWFEKLEQDIMKRISADGFPAHLDLQDQGRFFVGYYHQRQDFFEKKTANNENE